MRKVYLNNVPLNEALKRFLKETKILRQTEEIPVASAAGRVTASPVFAKLSMPGYHAAAMDGIAVPAEVTFSTSDQNPLTLTENKEFVYVDTGNSLPTGFNAVIKIEDIQPLPNGKVEIMAPATPWQHVRAVGEDVVAGELIVPSCHHLKPADLGALLAGGVTVATVFKKPRVVIIPTGTDLVPPGEHRSSGDVPDFNSTVVSSYLVEWGADPIIYPITPDDPAALTAAVEKGANEGDLVLVLAGSSAGSKDYTYQIIAGMGEVFIHGVATRPGKPTILGKVNDRPVIGLPGYPVSAYLSLEWFARPLIFRYLGQALPVRDKLIVTLGRRVVSEIGTEEYVRMSVGYMRGKYIATPLTRGAGVTMSLVKADGLLIIPPESLGYEQGETVEIELYRPTASLKNNLLVAGSHDLIIDLLATTLKERNPNITLSSAHLGSMGGISAISKGQAHLAGVHLFHPESGDYNAPYIRQYLPGADILLITLAHRMQGWIVPQGNPDEIKELTDLTDKKIAFVNRQKGAGTRLLFDHLLKNGGISEDDINGYHREEHTHLNVAAAVAAGSARIGLGILPAAKAFALEFIPVAEERYDLLMTKEFYCSEAGQAIMDIIRDKEFHKTVEGMDGYSMREAGSLPPL